VGPTLVAPFQVRLSPNELRLRELPLPAPPITFLTPSRFLVGISLIVPRRNSPFLCQFLSFHVPPCVPPGPLSAIEYERFPDQGNQAPLYCLSLHFLSTQRAYPPRGLLTALLGSDLPVPRGTTRPLVTSVLKGTPAFCSALRTSVWLSFLFPFDYRITSLFPPFS